MKLPFFEIEARLKPSRRRGAKPVGDSTDGQAAQNANGKSVFAGQTSDHALHDRNKDLQGTRRYRSYHVLRRNVPIIANFCKIVESIGAAAKFNFGPDDDRVMDLLTGGLQTSWAQHKADMFEALLFGYSVNEWATTTMGGAYRLRLIQRIPQSSIAEITLDDDNQIETFVQYLYDRMMIRRWQTFHIVVGQGQWGSGALADVASLGLKYLNLQAPTFDAYEMNVRDIHDFYIPAEHISRKSAIYQAIAEFVGSPRKYSNVRHILPSEPHEAVGATDIKLAPAAKRFEAMQRQVPIQHNDRLARTEYELALALSAQSMVLGGDKVGSYALAKEESNMLYQAIYGTLQRMGDEIERVVALLWLWNGYGKPPQVEVDTSAWVSVSDIADLLAKIATVPRDAYGAAVDEALGRSGLKAGPGELDSDSEPSMPAEDDDDGE